MLYIKNTTNAGIAVRYIGNNGVDTIFEFDCRRVYRDTGNIYSTGVTEISEFLYDKFYAENGMFKLFVDRGDLIKVDSSELNGGDDKLDAIVKENEKLKEELAKKTVEASKATNAEVEKLQKENASLKEMLNASKKKVEKE